jgi:alpha-galactosidase
MCLATPYREAAAERILELIRRFNLAYLKLDLTTIFNAYGEAPGCHAEGHDHSSWAESLALIYEGIGHVCRRISAEFPEVLLDLTFELWGQKHVVDYGLLRLGDLDWMSNVGDLEPESGAPRQVRTLLYGRAGVIPAERMLIGNLQAEGGDWLERIASTLGSAPLLSGDLRKVPAETLSCYAQVFNWFKQLRSEMALERFVPLGNHQAPSPNTWDGFARLSAEGEGLVALFKNDSLESRIKLELALPEGEYRLRSVLSRNLLIISADDLRRGLEVRFPGGLKAALLDLRLA